MDIALRGSGASALLLAGEDGRILATYGAVDSAHAPGSTLKPIVLQTALAAHLLTDRETILCRGNLKIDGHNLACTHPRGVLRMDARMALSNSCNTYFATLGRRMSTQALLGGLRSYGLSSSAQAVSPDQRALLALGVEGVAVTPRQLAVAYRLMSQRLTLHDPVLDGLVDSIDTGMAHAARIDHLPVGLLLGGKTGTMHSSSDPFGHGWFAGIVLHADRVQEVLVVCLPGGNGADAARLAQHILAAQLVPQQNQVKKVSR